MTQTPLIRITATLLLTGFISAAIPTVHAQTGNAPTMTQARATRDTAFHVYQDARTLFHIVRERYKKNKKTEDRMTLEKEAKTMLSALTMAVSQHLATLEAQFRDMQAITDADRNAVLQDVTRAEQLWLENTDAHGSPKTQATAMARIWPQIRLTMLRSTGLAQVARMQTTLTNLQEAQDQAAALIEKAQTMKHTTTSAEAHFAAFKKSVQNAITQTDTARHLYSSSADTTRAGTTSTNGQALLSEAGKSARASNAQLRLLIQALQEGH